MYSGSNPRDAAKRNSFAFTFSGVSSFILFLLDKLLKIGIEEDINKWAFYAAGLNFGIPIGFCAFVGFKNRFPNILIRSDVIPAKKVIL